MWVYISGAYRVSGFLFGFVFNKTFGPRNSVPWSQVAKGLPAKGLHTALSSECAPGQRLLPCWVLRLQATLPASIAVRPGCQLLWGLLGHCSLLQLLGIHVTEG